MSEKIIAKNKTWKAIHMIKYSSKPKIFLFLVTYSQSIAILAQQNGTKIVIYLADKNCLRQWKGEVYGFSAWHHNGKAKNFQNIIIAFLWQEEVQSTRVHSISVYCNYAPS